MPIKKELVGEDGGDKGIYPIKKLHKENMMREWGITRG